MTQDAHPSGAAAHRIRVARRSAGLSQAQLATELRVQRSAVSHWEAANAKSPNAAHLRGSAAWLNFRRIKCERWSSGR